MDRMNTSENDAQATLPSQLSQTLHLPPQPPTSAQVHLGWRNIQYIHKVRVYTYMPNLLDNTWEEWVRG